MTALWTLERLSVSLGGRPVLQDVNLSVERGEVVGVVGPNGAGKSTLLRAGLGLLKPAFGTIELDGQALHSLSHAQRAATVGYLPQERSPAWNMPAWRVAALGATNVSPSRAEDVSRAMLDELGLSNLAERGILDMSGGERARVLLARLLVTQAPLLIADEPAASLDPDAQLLILERLRAASKQGAGVVVTLHDLSLAARYCDQILVVHGGLVVARGEPRVALRPDILRRVFSLDGQLLSTPAGLVLAAARASQANGT